LRCTTRADLATYLADPIAIGSTRYYPQVSLHRSMRPASCPATTRRIRELAGLRNLLVHIYREVDDPMVYHGIHAGLGDFDQFVRCITERHPT